MSQRLHRVEGLLERLVERIAPDPYTSGRVGERSLTSSVSVEDELDSSSDALRLSAADHPPVVGLFDALREDSGICASSRALFIPTPESIDADVVAPPSKCAQISKILHAQFPCQHDIDAILATSLGAFFVTTFFCGINGPADPPSSVSEVPPETSHPALLAKRLMQLTNCIQKMSPQEAPHDLVSKVPLRIQMSRFVNTVSDLVAASDDLVGSVEGLEVLNLLALYHANAGNLRKSWLALRRALSVAQLMGADRWPDNKPLKSVDPRSDPSNRTRASDLWYRINFSDRYLSLLLGLSAASDDNSFAEDERMAHHTPVEKLERLHTVITGAIIKRNLSNNKQTATDATFGTTQAIDCDLELAAKSMGAEWWQPIELIDTSTATPYELVQAHMHILMQMNHYHLLILLHLPYMMRDPKERRWDYSKTTCLQASRGLLNAYLIFRHITDAASACRHSDYGGLTAAMTLLLGYLDPKLRARDAATSQQRAADRELVLAVRDVMKEIAARDSDKLANETSDIITRLLPLTDIDLTMEGRSGLTAPVRLEIPYLGTININPVSRRTAHQQKSPRQGGIITPSSTTYDNGKGETITISDHLEERASNHASVGADQPDSVSIDPSLQQPQAPSSFLASLGEDANFSFMQLEPDLSPYQFPELAADVDQWTFQGFDATFFENLFPQ